MEVGFQDEDFFSGGNAPRSATLHNPCEVCASAELQQTIFGKLLVGHTLFGTLVDVPSPGEHFVSQVFIASGGIGLVPAQQIPKGY